MTSCCIPQLSFSFYQHRAIRADFSGGQITSDAGLLPLRAFHAVARAADGQNTEKLNARFREKPSSTTVRGN